jgi:heme-degrading monooxygenase HmoA
VIRHLVGWTLTDETEAEKDSAAEQIRSALESLVGVIDGLLDLRVSRNAVDVAGNSDLALDSHFESEEALRGYLVHPAHLEAVAIVRAHTTGRWAIDFRD